MLSNTKNIAAWVSLISNFFLTIIKIFVGIIFNSQVLVADGVHNAADVVASIVTVGSVRISSLPADEDHPYGHGKAEVIASGMVGIILLLAALFIGYESINKLLGPAPEVHFLAFITAIVSLVWKELLYLYTIRIGRKHNSKSLIATAYDHLADVYASLAAMIGIGTALLGEEFNLTWAKYGDSFAGIIVAVLVLRISIIMGKESIGILMEENVESIKLEQYKEAIEKVPNVKSIDRIRARELGNYILVDLRVGVPGEITVQEGHDITRKIKQSVMELDSDVKEVLVHLNPWYEKTAN